MRSRVSPARPAPTPSDLEPTFRYRLIADIPLAAVSWPYVQAGEAQTGAREAGVIARTAVLAVAFAAAQSAPAPVRWRVVYSMPHGTFSIDPASVRREEDRVTVTTRLASRDPASGAIVTAELRFDCGARTSTMLRAVVRERDGRDVAAPDLEPAWPEPVAGYPGLEAALNELCLR
jgi:hypothetical protein